MKPSNQTRLRDRAPLALGVWRVIGHLVGVLAVAGIVAAPFFSTQTVQGIWQAAQFSGFSHLIGKEAVLHLGVSACFWAALVLLFHALRSSFKSPERAVRSRRGSVMTETLIVIPVALLLTFGLAQLAIVNIGGILTNLATVQAARTAWLWLPEVQAERRGVTRNRVVDLARIQAAAIVAPTAPSDFQLAGTEGSEFFRNMRGVLVGTQLNSPPNDSGRQGKERALQLAVSDGDAASGKEISFNRALDFSSFSTRTARKFSFAYLATEVSLIQTGEQVGARVTYKQLCVFPIANHIFGSGDTVGPRRGSYAAITREFTLHQQLDPNAKMPRQ
ncbi:MAG: hypothetical protein H0U74_12630 [Bradymonadaceae bacterium]|nr:hypothetical protein [Lujinxingiaceae bacterium]